MVLETVRKLLMCRTTAFGCHVYTCPSAHIRIVPHSCKSHFCPTCSEHATDHWADEVLNYMLDVPCHHVMLSAPWQLRPIMAFNREGCLSLLARADAGCLNQWAREQHGMRLGMVAVIHTFGADLRWHPHLHKIPVRRIHVFERFHRLAELNSACCNPAYARPPVPLARLA